MRRAIRWMAALVPVAVHAQVTTAQYDNFRTSATTRETTLAPRNVDVAHFGLVKRIDVDGDVYAQVLYMPAVTIRGKGTHATIFVATEHNSVYALDASSGETLWRVNLSGVVRGGRPLTTRDVSCPFIRPEVGITSTPVIDSATGTIYVLARTKENGEYAQRLHALDITSGAERGAPARIDAAVRGSGEGSQRGVIRFDAQRENPRAALLLTHGRVVIAWGSSCDVGPYHGWVMAFDARTLDKVAAINITPDGDEAGIWQGDAGIAADEDGHVFLVTGNGTFHVSSGGRDYGDAVLRLDLDGNRFTVGDYFAPSNQKELEDEDGDLGSGGPLLIPDQPGAHRHLLFAGGKNRIAYLLDRDRLGHFDPSSDAAAVQSVSSPGMIFGSSAYWNGHVFTMWGGDALRDRPLVNGRLTSGTHTAETFSDPGATPTVTSNGARDGIVWSVESRSFRGSDRAAVLHAFDASDLSHELWSSEMAPGRDRAGTALRFAFVTVAAGRAYLGAENEVDIYGLLDAR